jgi:transposase
MSKMDRDLSPVQRSQQLLFLLPQGESMPVPDELEEVGGSPRLRAASREQIEFRACCWNDLLPDDHQARIVWQYVLGLDLSLLLDRIKAVHHRPGHPPIDPRIMLALWLYATLRGVGSARELARRCETDLPFQWICGGVSVNYHTLADFRTRHVEFLDGLLTTSVALLMQQELVTLDRVAQDGMRVRASAGAASFRRGPTLEEHLAEAKAQVEALKAELEADPGAASKRQQAARQRAASERLERLQKALVQLPEIEAKKPAGKKDQARASTTDADARVMKMANGGFNPAYNVELATDTATQIITGVSVINSGSDRDQMAPMIEQHETRYGETPREMLVDGGFVKKEDIVAVSQPQGSTTVYAPVPASRDKQIDPHVPKADDAPAVAEWRQRMATAEAQEIYKDRAATAECVNAIARNRGLQQFRVRGSPKVLAVMLWYVLAHNLMRTVALCAKHEENVT